MQIGSFEFKPALWPTIAALVIVPGFCGLGIWQLDRAADKQERLQAYAQSEQFGPANINLGQVFDATPGYRRVRLTGHYDGQHQFLLDNQMQDGRVGYHVFTPLLITSSRAILVNRGWLPQGTSRSELPALTTPQGEVSMTGVLSPEPGYGMLLGDDIESDKIWPRVVQAIVLPRLQHELSDVELAPQVLLLDPDEAGGFVRIWKIVQFGPERNRGYAFQWFSMAAAVLIIFIVVNTRRRVRVTEE
jgi:surfeit locus 1 family protein